MKRMNFFKDLDWKALENKTLPPVYNIPDVVGVNINEIQRESLETMQEYFEVDFVVFRKDQSRITLLG